jgi:hypothetical protein
LVAVGTLAVGGGCGSNDPKSPGASATTAAATPSASRTTSATELLAASTKDVATTSYKFGIKSVAHGIDVTGAIDPTSKDTICKTSVSAAGVTASIEVAAPRGDYYVKPTGVPTPGIPNGKWVHVDPAKLDSARSLALTEFTEPTGVQSLVKAVVAAEKAPGGYKGTIDLTKSVDTIALEKDEIKGLADAGKAIPFEATVDDKGRLASLKLSIPAAGASKADTVTFTFTDFGSPVTPTKPPAAKTVEATAAIYKAING